MPRITLKAEEKRFCRLLH